MLRILILLLRINWLNYRPADCLPNACFCEAVGSGFVRQPVNAYTNAAYLLAGLFILRFLGKTGNAGESPDGTLIPRKWLAIFGAAFIAVAIGSFIYHASFIFLGEEMDDDSMYLVGVFILLFQISRERKLTGKQFLLVYIFLNLLLETTIFFLPAIRGGLFALIIAAATIVELSRRKQGIVPQTGKMLLKANLVFLAAYFIWILDKTHILCDPHSL